MLNAASRLRQVTPKQPANDPNWANVSLLIQVGGPTPGSIADLSPVANSITSPGCTATSQGILIPNSTATTSNYISVPDSTALTFGSGNHTIEMDITMTSIPGVGTGLFGQWSSVFAYYLYIQTGSVVWYLNNAANIPINVSTIKWQYGVRYHVAFVRNGNTWSVYRNGFLLATATLSVAVSDATEALIIGGHNAGGADAFNGYMDRIRITKGVARYTSQFVPNFDLYPTS